MRKAAVALGTLGIGAGILYAFGRARERGVENQTPKLATSGRESDAIVDSDELMKARALVLEYGLTMEEDSTKT